MQGGIADPKILQSEKDKKHSPAHGTSGVSEHMFAERWAQCYKDFRQVGERTVYNM